jgi:hypothetical protein
MSLGIAVRSEPYLTPALAVCHEMVRRSRENLIILFRRLDEIGFQFWNNQVGLLYLMTSKEVAEPSKYKFGSEPSWDADEAYYFSSANKARADMLFPLSMQVWGRELYSVSFIGSHPKLCPFYTNKAHLPIYADPFQVALLFDPDGGDLEGFEGSMFGDEPASDRFIISVTDVYKAECSYYEQTAPSYGIRLPNPAADAKLDGIWYDTTFVGYLRKNFQWGGFPGWERYPNRPEKELAFLREGLLPI